MDDTGLGLPISTSSPEWRKTSSHAMVLAERLRDEPCDAFRPRSMRELFEQVGADSMALPIVGDDERDLGVVRARQAVEAADAR